MRYFLVGAAGRRHARLQPIPSLLALLTLIVVAGGVLALNSGRSASAQQAVVVEVVTPTFVLPNTEFPAVIRVDDVENLGTADIRLSYDPSALTFVRAVPDVNGEGSGRCEFDFNSAVPGILDLVLFCREGKTHRPLKLWDATFRSTNLQTETQTVVEVTQTDIAGFGVPSQIIPSTGGSSTVTIVPTPFSAEIAVPDIITPGDEFQASVQLIDDLASSGGQFSIDYDVSRFTFTQAQAGTAFSGCLADALEISPGTVNTVLACASAKTGTPLVLWTFSFEALSQAPSGIGGISIDGLILSDDRSPPYLIPMTVEDAQVRVSRTTDLAITKTDSRDPVVAGTPFTYTITVTNDGPENALGVVVTDQLPAEVTFDSAAQGCAYDGPSHTVTCAVGDVANGASGGVTISVTPQSGAAGTITNTASVTSFEIDPNAANDTATEDTFVIAPPTLTGTAVISTNEGGGGAVTTVDIDVSLSGAINMPVDVRFETSDGTATTADSDYTPVVNGLLTIPAGITNGTLQVEVVGDVRWEHDENFSVVITSAAIQDTAVSLDIVDGTTIVTIQNDDAPPTVSIQETSSIAEGGPGETTATDLEVTLSGLSGLPITVQYNTADGSATVANGDYTPVLPGSLTIPSDSLSNNIRVDAIGDDRYELDESFSIFIFNASTQDDGTLVPIADATSTVTILNDDPLPTLSIAGSASVAEGSAGTTATAEVAVLLSKPLDVDVTVTYGTAGLTAAPSIDYVLEVGSTVISSGNTTGTATFTIIGDDVVEGDETFGVGLINGSSSLGVIPIAPPTSSTVTILDDDSGIIAESNLVPTLDVDGVAVAEIRVERFKFQGGDLSFVPPGGVQSFNATLAFDTDLVEILGVRSATEFAGDTTFDSTSTPGQLTMSGSTATPTTTISLVLAKIIVRLIGSNASSTQFTLTNLQLTEGGTGTVYNQEFQASDTYRRGDVQVNGQVNGTDRLFLTQCILQLRATGTSGDDCNPINAASVLHDGIDGDTMDEADGLYISQFVVELRDVFFDLID